ncbi:hypothetical protein ACJX0J_041121, partial [Zea mays]
MFWGGGGGGGGGVTPVNLLKISNFFKNINVNLSLTHIYIKLYGQIHLTLAMYIHYLLRAYLYGFGFGDDRNQIMVPEP